MKGDYIAYNSGRNALLDGRKNKAFHAIAIGLAVANMCILVNAKVADEQRTEDRQNAALYDKMLLETIDAIAETGVPMDKAIEKGFLLQNYHTSQDPAMNTNSMKIHKDIRLAEAREIDGIERDAFGSYDTVFVYNPDFRDELAQKVVNAENCSHKWHSAAARGHGDSDGSFLNSAVGRSVVSTLTRGF